MREFVFDNETKKYHECRMTCPAGGDGATVINHSVEKKGIAKEEYEKIENKRRLNYEKNPDFGPEPKRYSNWTA